METITTIVTSSDAEIAIAAHNAAFRSCEYWQEKIDKLRALLSDAEGRLGEALDEMSDIESDMRKNNIVY